MRKRALRSLVVMMIAMLVLAMMPVSVSAASKTPGKVTITSMKAGKVSTKNNKCKVVVTWKKAANATAYEVYEKHGTGKWMKLKTCGKTIRKLTIKGVSAGKYSVKIRAVNKKKKGKFSKVKSKFINSPLTVQQYVKRCEPSLEKTDFGDGVNVSFKGNTMINSFDYEFLTGVEDLESWSESDKKQLKSGLYKGLADLEKEANSMKKTFKYDCGIKNAKVVMRYVYRGEVLASRTF